MKSTIARLTVLTLWLGSLLSTQAQWLTQTNIVKPGWTAVFLNVDASGYGQNLDQFVGSDPNNPIVEIWLWRGAVSPQQYVDAPQDLLSDGSHWIKWVRNASATPNQLESLVGNSAYLIHSSGSVNYTWKVLGKPVPPNYLWDITGLNLIGFSTPSANPPDFQDYLAPVPGFANVVQLYQYTQGPLVSLVNPAPVFARFSTPVTRGQAFWVQAAGVNNTYFGPFNVSLANPSGIDYGTSGGQVTVRLFNTTSNSLTVYARMLPSETPPYGQTNIVGVPPVLLRGIPNSATNASTVTYAFTDFANGPASWTLAPSGQPGSEITVVLGVNRYAMTAPAGSLFAGILQFTDALGFSEIDVPVTAQSASTAGLWVGSASVSQVGNYLKTYATNGDGTTMINTGTNFSSVTYSNILMATNLLTFNYGTNSRSVMSYHLTNLVVNTYTGYQFLYLSNSATVSVTNEVIQTYALTNVVITTAVTNVYVDGGGNVIWLTQNTTNISGSAFTTISNAVSTIQVAGRYTNGTPSSFPVVITNLISNFVIITNLLTTNGIFQTPVTIQTLGGTNFTSHLVTTNTAYSGALYTVYAASRTNATSSLVASNYAVTNFVATGYAITNYFPTNKPYAVVTNPPNYIVIYQQSNNYAISNQANVSSTASYYIVSNNYVYLMTNIYIPVDLGTNLAGITTNSVFSGFSSSSSMTASNFSNANLDYFFLPILITSNTPVLVTNSGSYVVAALNTNLGAVVAPYPLRLIIHYDGTTARLLQRVYYGLRQQTNIVVATTESVLDTATLNIARRISASQLPWTAANTPWVNNYNSPLALGGLLQFTVFDAYDDQTSNPFLHTYHPDHNNLDPTFQQELLPGAQSYNITRQISLNVSPPGTDFGSLTTANSILSGTYAESITLAGFNNNQRTFRTAGTFSLTRVSPIATLTTQ